MSNENVHDSRFAPADSIFNLLTIIAVAVGQSTERTAVVYYKF